MTENERSNRKTQFFQVMDATDDEFFIWAGHQFFNEAKIRFLQMPWDSEHPVKVYIESKTAAKVAEKTTTQKIIDNNAVIDTVIMKAKKFKFDPLIGSFNKQNTFEHKIENTNWHSITDLPDIDKKAYHHIGKKLMKGMLVKFKLKNIKMYVYGEVISRTKNFVKVKSETGTINAVPYENIYYAAYNLGQKKSTGYNTL